MVIAAFAQTAGPEEVAFWDAVSRGNRAEEYRAYLDAYPGGVFAPLARLRLQGGPLPSPAEASPADRAREANLRVTVRPLQASVRLVDGVSLDLDAQALRASSNLRVVVVPAAAPDTPVDPQRFLEDSTPVHAGRLRLTVPAGPPGQDEVRLYHIPPFAASYALAGRAPVWVEAGITGAILARDLGREAVRLGPVRFEAAHRDRPVLVQAAFLRIRPRTDWNMAWFNGQPIGEVSRQIVVLNLGQPNVAPDMFGSLGEVVCLLSVDSKGMLDRLAGLQVGDPVLVSGVPTSWSNARPADPVALDGCGLRD